MYCKLSTIIGSKISLGRNVVQRCVTWSFLSQPGVPHVHIVTETKSFMCERADWAVCYWFEWKNKKCLEFSFALKIFSLLNFFQLSGQGEGGDEAVAVRQDEHWGCCEQDMGEQWCQTEHTKQWVLSPIKTTIKSQTFLAEITQNRSEHCITFQQRGNVQMGSGNRTEESLFPSPVRHLHLIALCFSHSDDHCSLQWSWGFPHLSPQQSVFWCLLLLH